MQFKRVMSIITFLSILTFGSSLWAATWYVKTDGSDEMVGTSWNNAFQTIQKAVEVSIAGDEIWVAAGTYSPIGVGKTIAIYGGFGGTEIARDQRNWVSNVTVISSNGLGSCGSVYNDATIDGFTFTNGKGEIGGGLYIRYIYREWINEHMIYHPSRPIISNCIFSHNTSLSGGGIYNDHSSPTIINCQFLDNYANDGYGGALYTYVNPTGQQVSVTISGCTFYKNKARISGGGIYNRMFNPSGSSVTITNCVFSQNVSEQNNGGAIVNYASSSQISNCLFYKNYSYSASGASILNQLSSPIITNCTFYGNMAEAEVKCGGIFNLSNSSPTITNCIFWENTGNQVENSIPDSQPIITYSNIQHWVPDQTNISQDPLFVDAGNGDFRLTTASPCIDAGNPNAPALPQTDIAGNPRILGSAPDMGAYECYTNLPPVANAGPNINISSEDRAFTVIQGTASDPDSDQLQYRWVEGQSALSTWQDVGMTGEAYLDLNTIPVLMIGQHTLTLETSDGRYTAADDMILTIANAAPHAAATGGGVYEFSAPISLRGEVADFDGDVLDYEWWEGDTKLFSGTVQAISGGTPVTLPIHTLSNLDLGTHVFTLKISDGINEPVMSSITVEVIDKTAPTIAPVANKTILWPPNHNMVDIIITSNAFDNSGAPVVLSARVASNEPEDGLGDGDTAPDWSTPIIDQVNGIISLQIRAERSGSGNGRVYTVTITATDQSGNASQASVNIVVPHDKSTK